MKVFKVALLICVGLPLAAALAWAGTTGFTSLSIEDDITVGDDLTVSGDLKVGDGTPGITQDGEDAYIEGTLEIDGSLDVAGRTMILAQYSADPNATSATCAVSGLDSDDYLVATMNTNNATGNFLRAVPATGYATLYWSTDPAGSVKVTIMTWQD